MCKIKYIFNLIILFVCFSFTVNVAYSQEQKEVDKIIIEGKTYYIHVVQKGEGFYGIAKKYGVSQKEIHEANPNSIFGLKPGDILYIPVIKGRNANVDEMEDSNQFIFHSVEKGQTLYFISRKYNVSIDEIKKNNVGLDSNLIPGSIIKIPVPKERSSNVSDQDTYRYHKVESKETLYSISKKYEVEMNEIIKCNPALKSGILKVGSTLRIPYSEPSEVLVVNEEEQKDAVDFESGDYLYHRIQEGDTFYSLMRKYGLKMNVLREANPSLNQDDLSIGYVVRIPKKELNKVNEKGQQEPDFKIHNVRKRETIYSIAHSYGVSIEDIQKANPTLILDNIRKGSKLKIPTQAYLVKLLEQEQEELQKQKQEQLHKQEVFAWDSVRISCDEYDYRIHKEEVKVAVLLPFNVALTKQANVTKKVVNGEEVEIQRQYPELAIKSRSFVEFYEGVLLAVDSLKKQGVNMKVYTYDTAPDTLKVKQILNRPELASVDMIIGPAFASNLKIVSDFSYKHGIKLIYPLSNVNTELVHNPYIIQVNTPDSLLFKQYARHIVHLSDTSKLIIINSTNPKSDEMHLTKNIRDGLYMKNVVSSGMPDYSEVTFSDKSIQGIVSLLSKEKRNIIVVPSQDEADVSKIVTTLHGVVQSGNYKITLVGFNSWLRYQTIEAEDIHDLNTEILTTYAFDYNSNFGKDFINKFRKDFYTEPFAVAPYFVRPDKNSRFSKYGFWGFDVAYYFISARVKYGRDFEYCLDKYKTKQLQFNFNFKRVANWGGFYNSGLYVLEFTPQLNIVRSPLN